LKRFEKLINCQKWCIHIHLQVLAVINIKMEVE
jgi:hypothetical protein